jgi:endonuclease/exonuclease/phosphatase family metal-dependent hydrolase
MSDTMPAFTVMTFNVRGAHFDDGANQWLQRAALNIATIRQHAPDLIGFQEVHPANLDAYREHLAQYEYLVGPHYNDKEPYQHATIAWNPERLRLVESGGFWLSLTPECYSRAWDTACTRAATWARLEWIEAGLTLLHLNTHLDHIGEEARREGANVIVRQLQQLGHAGEPIIVTGDFNCPPNSAAHRIFEEYGFADTYAAAGNHAAALTYHEFLGPAYVPTEQDDDRIDWILLHDQQQCLNVTACDIIQDAAPPLYPSDHYPVLATFARA